ncbi:MAG: hypothetical protein C0446_08475 [Chitinophaga sp.]|nr:hypothetical protein [Chitinophaga sp.]
MSIQRPTGNVIYNKVAWATYLYTLYALDESGVVGFYIDWNLIPKTDLGHTHLYGRELLMSRPHSLSKKKFKNKRKKRLTKIK